MKTRRNSKQRQLVLEAVKARPYHLFCTGCGRGFDAPMPYHAEYDDQVGEETGFRVSRHRLVFEGLCPHCVKKQK